MKMITISCLLELTQEDKVVLDQLCRHWSSAFHTVYNLLMVNPKLNCHQLLMKKFDLNYRYAHEAIVEAKALLDSCKELGRDPQKVIFGSRKSFYQLKKRHLCDKQRKQVKELYRETRQYNLYSIGSKANKGNVNTRLEGNCLRINTVDKYIYATIHAKNHKLWHKLLAATHYTVRVTRRNNKYHAYFSFTEQNLPEETITFVNGAIGVDLNAMPSNLAWCEVNHEGNFLTAGT